MVLIIQVKRSISFIIAKHGTWLVIWNLQGNGMLNSTIRSWVLQDAESIYKNLGLLERINKDITDFAAKADTWMYGAGNKRA
jgi:hypothetical protein